MPSRLASIAFSILPSSTALHSPALLPHSSFTACKYAHTHNVGIHAVRSGAFAHVRQRLQRIGTKRSAGPTLIPTCMPDRDLTEILPFPSFHGVWSEDGRLNQGDSARLTHALFLLSAHVTSKSVTVNGRVCLSDPEDGTPVSP